MPDAVDLSTTPLRMASSFVEAAREPYTVRVRRRARADSFVADLREPYGYARKRHSSGEAIQRTCDR